MDRLRGKVAAITGGASGIGAGTVRRFVDEGAHVLIADLDEDRGASLASELGAAAAFLRTDVSKEEDVAAMVAETTDRFGRIDVLFNNAGITGSWAAARCHETPVDEWDRVLGTNLRGPFLMTRAVLPVMLAAGRGHVINLVSIGGVVAIRGRCAYTASKGGALMFTKSIAADYAADGIR